MEKPEAVDMSVFDDIKDVSSQDREGRYSREELLAFYRYFGRRAILYHFCGTHLYSPYLRPPPTLDLTLEKLTSRIPLKPASYNNDARESLFHESEVDSHQVVAASCFREFDFDSSNLIFLG